VSDELKASLIALSVAKDAADAELCAMRLRVEHLEWLHKSERQNAEEWRRIARTAEATVARVKATTLLDGKPRFGSIPVTVICAALEGEQ
jgi:hypothetical protein